MQCHRTHNYERPLTSTLFERPSKANSSTFIAGQQQSLTKIPLPYVGPHSTLLSKAVASGDEGASVISGGPITSRARKTILHHVWNSFLLFLRGNNASKHQISLRAFNLCFAAQVTERLQGKDRATCWPRNFMIEFRQAFRIPLQKGNKMSLRINDEAPNFTCQTTDGLINFHEWIGNGWAILFSHPKDFTPVCTTELGYSAALQPEFQRRNCKIIGLSVDPITIHTNWALDIEETQGHRVNYPMIGDPELKIAKAVRHAAGGKR
jgi:peroxiredoxin